MSQLLVRTLLDTELKSWADANGYSVAFEGVGGDFEPVYIRSFLIPGVVLAQFQTHRAYLGTYQMNIVVPKGQGMALAEAIKDSLDSRFYVNMNLVSGGLTLVVTDPVSANRPIQEPDATVLPVYFRYRADKVIGG